jgi:hypothetical protein
LAYNQEEYVAEAIQGAFSQTYSPLEIILSDDCSTDRTFEIMQEMAAAYKGPHRVVLHRNSRNLGGPAQCINAVSSAWHGILIIGAAGDDVSLPHRTDVIYREWVKSNRSAFSLWSKVIAIDKKGQRIPRPPDPLFNYADLQDVLKGEAYVLGASHAWHRAVFDTFGPLGKDILAEDGVIAFRSSLLGKVVHIDEPLVLYRIQHKPTSVPGTAEDLAVRRRRHAVHLLAIQLQQQADYHLAGDADPKVESALSTIIAKYQFMLNMASLRGSRAVPLALKALGGDVPARLIIRELVKSLFPRLHLWKRKRRAI